MRDWCGGGVALSRLRREAAHSGARLTAGRGVECVQERINIEKRIVVFCELLTDALNRFAT